MQATVTKCTNMVRTVCRLFLQGSRRSSQVWQ